MTFFTSSMFSTTITLRPNGSMTLPKKLRDAFKTRHFLLVEVAEGILMIPIYGKNISKSKRWLR